MKKSEIKNTIISLYNGNKTYQEIQVVIHILYPDEYFHTIDIGIF